MHRRGVSRTSLSRLAICLLLAFTIGCKQTPPADSAKPTIPSAPKAQAPIFSVDPATAGTIAGQVRYTGPRLPPARIDMSQDPACVQAHRGKTTDESQPTGSRGGLANAFVYIQHGLEDKNFAVPSTAVTVDQNGCWFRPHVLGIQVGQTLQVVNSDPVTHNIHPMAHANREWNHSQGPGDAPLSRRFAQPEIMIPVKCNIHGWMHAYIGVLAHPFFAVTAADGSFSIPAVPQGSYTLGVWTEKLGAQEQRIVVAPNSRAEVTFNLQASAAASANGPKGK